MQKFVLASGSPRRKEILEQIGVEFLVIPSTKEEVITSANPIEVVEELSYDKALDVVGKIKGKPELLGADWDQFLVIGADTIVVYKDRIMGKPSNRQDAIDMLSVLQGKCHQVYSGVTLYYHSGAYDEEQVFTFYECTDVTMYPMNQGQIEDYVDTGEPMDKAGAYAIQGKFTVFIKEIKGEYNTVVGFPIARIYQELKKRNIDIQ